MMMETVGGGKTVTITVRLTQDDQHCLDTVFSVIRAVLATCPPTKPPPDPSRHRLMLNGDLDEKAQS